MRSSRKERWTKGAIYGSNPNILLVENREFKLAEVSFKHGDVFSLIDGDEDGTILFIEVEVVDDLEL